MQGKKRDNLIIHCVVLKFQNDNQQSVFQFLVKKKKKVILFKIRIAKGLIE